MFYSITIVSDLGLFAAGLLLTTSSVFSGGDVDSSSIMIQSSSSFAGISSFRFAPRGGDPLLLFIEEQVKANLLVLLLPDFEFVDDGISWLMRDSLKLKTPEFSRACVLVVNVLRGVKPVLIFEPCELLDRFLTGEFRKGDWVRPFVGVSEP